MTILRWTLNVTQAIQAPPKSGAQQRRYREAASRSTAVSNPAS